MFKKLFGTKLTKKQKAKITAVETAMKTIMREVENSLIRDERVLSMKEYQIIYGIAHVMFEDQVMKEIAETGQIPPELQPYMTGIVSNPRQPQTTANKEQGIAAPIPKNEMVLKKNRTVH